MSRKNYTDEDVKQAVSQSTSIRQVLIKVGLAPKGGNYACMKRRIAKLKLCTKHFTGHAWNKGRKLGPKRPTEDYLSNKQTIGSFKLKKRLFNEEYFERKCYKCGRKKWLGLPIPLELEHINGDNLDNSLNNLTILCPNCHAQTETYRGKNKKNT